MRDVWCGLWPSIVLGLFACGLGTLHGAAIGWRAAVGHVLLFAMLAGSGWIAATARTAIAVSRGGLLSPGLLALAFVASWLLSPVPRAGATALALSPALVAFAVCVAVSLVREPARVWAGRGFATVALAVGGWALVSWRLVDTPGASLPLGHHNLLAAFLVGLLPLAFLAWPAGAAHRRSKDRLWIAAASVVAVAAVVASRSLGGLAALGALALFILPSLRSSRQRVGLAGVLGGLAVLAGGRLLAIGRGLDTSAHARLGYLEAGWQGWLERPLVGWGPGASAWTLGLHLRADPEVRPPGQVVADLHSLPAGILYELGLLGVLGFLGLCGGILAALSRSARAGRRPSPALASAGAWLTIGTVSGLLMSVPALAVGMATTLGVALAARRGRRATADSLPVRRRLPSSLQRFTFAVGTTALALALGLWQAPRDLAHLLAGETLEPQKLQRAVELDPDMPLYRFRVATRGPSDSQASSEAAEAALGLAPLWLTAGLDPTLDRASRIEALRRACTLDPLGAMGPWHLAWLVDDGETATASAARALLLEPRLLASPRWVAEDRVDAASRAAAPDLAAAVERVEGLLSIEEGWRAAFVERAEEVALLRASDRTAAEHDRKMARLVLSTDEVEALSMSLHAFRRPAVPIVLTEVEVDLALAQVIDLPPAYAALEAALAFSETCGL